MKKLNIRVLCLFLLCSTGIFLWWFLSPVDTTAPKEAVFRIEKGQGSREIAYALEQRGFVRSAPLFRMAVLTMGISGKLQAGDYALSQKQSAFAIARKFARGDVIKETITIIEGWDVKEINDYLASKGFSIELPLNEEGYLFPDTYYVPWSISASGLTKLMKENFAKKVGEVSPEIVVMASLIEKEVQTPEDKKLVAGILWKRLKYGIALQVDAEPGTYKYRGLPPNPIANPGLESIKAALYPTESPYLYYLSAKDDGRTIFSKTFDEHNLAKSRYLKK
ncbi:MAG: endolytic transglycosylase MltG [Candidatus Wildermuthbacteria bacterium]|nr:endolytic transglycosylase MltG [Candidatus Wildermuthbacteria bacterium]